MPERIDGPHSPIVLPPLPLNEWETTKETLHRYAQIVGKIRLWSGARRNHWWNVTLYVSSRGLTTGPNPYGDETFEVFFDFVAHELRVTASTGATFSFALEDGMSVADFYRELLAGLGALGIEVAIDPTPYDTAGTLSTKRRHARLLRQAIRRKVLAHPGSGGSDLQGVLGPLQREDQPGASLLARLRSGRNSLFRKTSS
jgi:hypothetical protein